MRELADLRRVRGLSLTESFFELTRLRVLDVWTHLARMGYGVKDYFDFTDKRWVALPVERQIQYASEYQNWYAERLGEGVERSFNGMVFRLIPPGQYWMGSPLSEEGREEDEEQRKIHIKSPFWCGKYEVTQWEWLSVMRNNPSYFQGGSRYPVENVSWNDCQRFCKKTGFKLLHEKQWEYACRGGTTTAYSFGDDAELLSDYAYYDNNSGHDTHQVGEKLPNSFGLYDMHGNVSEWCQNKYEFYSTYRSIRGGSWGHLAVELRSPYRDGFRFEARIGYLGLRVCKPVTF